MSKAKRMKGSKICGLYHASDQRIAKAVGRLYGREAATLTREELDSARSALVVAYEKGGAYKSDVRRVLRLVERRLHGAH